MTNTEYDFKADLNNSLHFQLVLLGLINKDTTISIRNLINSHLDSKATFLGMPCVSMLSPELVIGRDFCSALAVIMSRQKTSFELVRAKLERLNSFLRIKDGNFICNPNRKMRDIWYLQTKDHVFFPGLDMCLKKQDFENLMSPKITEIITSKELYENCLFKAIYSLRHQTPLSKKFDYIFYCLVVDKIFGHEYAQSQRQDYISTLIKFYLYQDKITLAKHVAHGNLIKDNYNVIYDYFIA